MEYAIQDVAQIIGARTKALHDCTISILLTDSRRLSFPETSLFFALATKTNDGHRYVQDLYKLRVRNFVVSKMLPEFEQMEEANFLLVKDVLAALQKLVAYHRKRFQILVIGITGSNGKTVVKEFLYQLLHNEFDIVRSPRSYNSQIGVPQWVHRRLLCWGGSAGLGVFIRTGSGRLPSCCWGAAAAAGAGTAEKAARISSGTAVPS